MIWVILILIGIYILANNKSEKTENKKLVTQLPEKFSKISKPESLSLLPFSKSNVQEFSDRVSAKASKNCSDLVHLFCKNFDQQKLEQSSIYKLIQEFDKKSEFYNNLLVNDQDLEILKIYAIKRWLISAKDDTFEPFIQNVKVLLKNSKIRNPILLKKIIDAEVLKFS